VKPTLRRSVFVFVKGGCSFLKVSRVKGLITIALVVVLLLNTGVALAKGPAPKATGEVGIPVDGWWAEFSAHHEEVIDEIYTGKGSMRIWSDVIEREFLFDDVKYVRIKGNKAWFAAKCTDDNLPSDDPDYKVDQWLFVKVLDGGTPGRNGDYIGWDWDSGTDEADVAKRVEIYRPPAGWWGVIKGNLKVH